MKNRKSLLPLVAFSLILIAASPAAYASTLKVTLNPTTKVADIASTSTTDFILTYPSNSTLSHFLQNYTSSVSWNGSFNGTSEGAGVLQGSLEEEDHDVKVMSMNVSYSLSAKGNATALVVHKVTDISAVVQGVFKVENGTVVADLDWKAFSVQGALNLDLGDHVVDVNLVGSSFDTQLSDHPIVATAVFGLFGGYDLWHRPTLNFSALNSPLSTWTKYYDSVTNTTTYSKTISGNSSLNISADFNGQKYTLTMRSDPSAEVGIQGYAVANGNSLVIQPTPIILNPLVWVAGGVAAVAASVGGVYLLRRHRAPAMSSPSIPSGNK